MAGPFFSTTPYRTLAEGLGGVAAYHAHFVDASGTGPGWAGVAAGNWCGWHTFGMVWHADGRWTGGTTRPGVAKVTVRAENRIHGSDQQRWMPAAPP